MSTKANRSALKKLVLAWLENIEVIAYADKCDGTGDYEPVKILRFDAVTQPINDPVYVEGLDNNQDTLTLDAEDLLLNPPARKRMKTYREFKEQPDDQAYLCHDPDIATAHGLPCPFKCGCRVWQGYGFIRIEFYSHDRRIGNDFQAAAHSLLGYLEVIPGEKWIFDSPIDI